VGCYWQRPLQSSVTMSTLCSFRLICCHTSIHTVQIKRQLSHLAVCEYDNYSQHPRRQQSPHLHSFGHLAATPITLDNTPLGSRTQAVSIVSWPSTKSSSSSALQLLSHWAFDQAGGQPASFVYRNGPAGSDDVRNH